MLINAQGLLALADTFVFQRRCATATRIGRSASQRIGYALRLRPQGRTAKAGTRLAVPVKAVASRCGRLAIDPESPPSGSI
jgi:hypothetical protein